MRLFVDSNVIGVFAQGDTGTTCGDFVELRAWLLQQLMWNPSQDEQVLRKEFLGGFYGAAAKEFSLRYDAEGVTWDSVATALAHRFNKEPSMPASCAGVPAKDWIDIQDDRLLLFTTPEYIDDAAASDAMAVRVPGNGNGWLIQYIMPEAMAPTGPWYGYAVAKAVAAPGSQAKGTAFRIGLLNPQAKKDTSLATATLEETAGGSFRTYDLGVHDLTGGMNFYVAGVSRPEVQSILVDRIFFVREKK